MIKNLLMYYINHYMVELFYNQLINSLLLVQMVYWVEHNKLIN